MDTTARRIISPTSDLNVYLYNYLPEKQTGKLERLFKNLNSHFKKLLYSITFINKIQKDTDFIKKYDQNQIVSIMNIEYCYLKISTIWDISYQIADLLVGLPKKDEKDKEENKYTLLEKEFLQYTENLPNLDISWYTAINRIRNKVVHGGINTTAFYIKEMERICFQVYDNDLNDLIKPNNMYSNQENNLINFADYYFTFFTHALYSYLCDFFKFILLKLNEEPQHDLDKLKHPFAELLGEVQTKNWALSDIDTFIEISDGMFALDVAKGNLDVLDQIEEHKIKSYYDEYLFSFMRNIGDYLYGEAK